MRPRPTYIWLCLLAVCWLTGCPDEIRQRQLAKELKHRKQLQQLQQSVRRCQGTLQALQQSAKARKTPLAALPRPLPRSAFHDPKAAPFQGNRWSAKHIPIGRIPRNPSRGKRPNDKKMRFIRNTFWRYLRIRRKRIKNGLSKRLCQQRRGYLRKHPSDPQAALTVALCHANAHFKGRLYFQVDFSGAMVIHRKRWRRDDIRRFLSRYRALVNKARSLGFYRLIFVGEDDFKRRQKRLDFQHKWYGYQVSFEAR